MPVQDGNLRGVRPLVSYVSKLCLVHIPSFEGEANNTFFAMDCILRFKNDQSSQILNGAPLSSMENCSAGLRHAGCVSGGELGGPTVTPDGGVSDS